MEILNSVLIYIMLASGCLQPPVEEIKPVVITPWESLEELKEYLNQDESVLILHAGEDGNCQIADQCEDLAIGMRDRALSQGRLLETEILIQSEVLEYYPAEIRSQAPHCICKAIIGNDVYFIEPGNDRVWLAYYLD